MNKRAMLIFMMAVFAGLGLKARAEVSVQFGVSVSDEQQNFYLALGDYYKVPTNDVVAVRAETLPDDEMPAAFFIAQRAGIAPREVVDLRLRHMAWRDICIHYSLSPNIFYVPGQTAYGYERLRNARRWRSVALSDDEVVGFCNQRFFSEHYGYSPQEVARQHRQGVSYVAIHRQAYDHRSPERRDVRGWERHDLRRDEARPVRRVDERRGERQVNEREQRSDRYVSKRKVRVRDNGRRDDNGNGRNGQGNSRNGQGNNQNGSQNGSQNGQGQNGQSGNQNDQGGHGNGRGNGNGNGVGEYQSNGHGAATDSGQDNGNGHGRNGDN